MTPSRTALLVLGLLATGGLYGGEETSFGPFQSGESLTKDDLGAIQKLVISHGRPWIIKTSRGCQPGACFVATVFLSPRQATPLMRRGRAVELINMGMLRTSESSWSVAAGGDPYPEWAQFAPPGDPFRDPWEDPGLRSHPFRVIGHIADSDLAAVASFIRNSPVIPDAALPEVERRSVYFVPGSARLPSCDLYSVEAKNNGTFEAWCSGHGRFIVARRDQKWEIVRGSSWQSIS